MKINLVLTDLDGTVVKPESNEVSASVLAAITAGQEHGIRFAAVTGRPHWMAKDLLLAIGFKDPCIFEGGGVIMNPATREILWSKTVPVETTKAAVSQLIKHASIIEYDDGVKDADQVSVDTISKPAFSIWASVPAGSAESLAEDLAKLPDIAVHANNGPGGDFSRTGIQVTHIEADKEHAVRELLRILDIDKENTLAIGDGDNDLPLLKNAAIKIAMGNATDKLKAVSDHIVADVSHDGFSEAIRKYAIS